MREPLFDERRRVKYGTFLLRVSIAWVQNNMIVLREVNYTRKARLTIPFVEVPMGISANGKVVRFKTLALVDVPHSRNGKHKTIVSAILRDLDELKEGAALKVPLAELGDIKENVRSALNRATRKARKNVATATDDSFLYVWNTGKIS